MVIDLTILSSMSEPDTMVIFQLWENDQEKLRSKKNMKFGYKLVISINLSNNNIVLCE